MKSASTAHIMVNDRQSNILTTIRSYGKGLLGFIRKRVKSDADAEDILQDVWYQLSALVNAEPVEQTGAWLYKVARNKIIDKYRKKSESVWEERDDDDGDDLRDFFMAVNETPETKYQERLIWKTLFEALDELPKEQRDVFVWHELDHIPFAEISETTGEPVGKLISRKRYAVLHLRKRLHVFYRELMDK